jgi:hypothetical protein
VSQLAASIKNKKSDGRIVVLEERIKQNNEEKAVLNDTIRELGQHLCNLIEDKEQVR